MKQVYCTVLSKYRLYQGIALYKSLVDNAEYFRLYILCVDDECYNICSKIGLKNVALLKIADLQNDRLTALRNKRRLSEYCWTLKAFLIEHVLGKIKSGEYITYLDADMYFFSNPSVIYKKEMSADVMLSEHDYSKAYKSLSAYCGKYNSGFMIFKNVTNALNVLKWWQNQCLKWCFNKVKEGKFGDQKYLEFMPKLFENVCSISTKGVNIAPWNEEKYNIIKKEGALYVDADRLVCYHFSGFRILGKNKIALASFRKEFNKILHSEYIYTIKAVIEDIERVAPNFDGFGIEKKISKLAKYYDI
ncbi:putative nucleotide-diphospho-sugar transferase [Herbivorax sp. ANBcel31]|uniref:putative nucleotide-diphospho-sugar transferase n=1 Tax=Herbivorax sp. ANBcel31 TaxID=3069754 RepID=UPI0027AFD3C8|nr:putative nucleotide-diphospho-sugar transferase [Herbivorax sp. ANBcel31]MDQ2087559.1 putative nucleotide-diphospho-sugar transferase [Herbivorax sp. ANBcel31]